MKEKAEKLSGNVYFSSSFLPVAVRRVEGYDVTHEHDYTGHMHYHDFAELVVIFSGEGEQMINGFRYPVSAGDVFMMQDRTEHCFTEYCNLKIVNIMFSQELFTSMHVFLHQIPGYNVIFRIEPGIRSGGSFRNCLHLSQTSLSYVLELIRRLEGELTGRKNGYEAASTALLLEIIIYLSRSFSENGTDQRAALRLGRLLSELESRFAEDWSLDEMAHSSAMSVNNFLRIFKSATGVTPMDYLSSLRLTHARRLLRDSALSVSEIAFRCGFHDSNYFTKKFSGAYGCSPREFRAGLK